MNFGLYWAISLNVMLLFFRLTPGISTDFGRNQIFLTLSVISLIIYGSKMSWVKVPIVFFLIVVLINQWSPLSMNVYNQWVFFSIGIALFSQSLDQSTMNMKYLDKGFFVALWIACLWSALEYFGFQPLAIFQYFNEALKPTANTSSNQLHGILQNRAFSACLIAALFPFCLKKSRIYFVVVPLLAVYTLGSATATLAIVSILYVFGLKYLGWLKSSCYLLLFSIVAAILVPIEFWSMGNRWKLWTYVIRHQELSFFAHGVGYATDMLMDISYPLLKETFGNMHNEYITAYLSFGLCGLFYMVYLMTRIRLTNVHYAASAVAILVSAVGFFPLHKAPLVAILILVYPHAIKTGVKT